MVPRLSSRQARRQNTNQSSPSSLSSRRPHRSFVLHRVMTRICIPPSSIRERKVSVYQLHCSSSTRSLKASWSFLMGSSIMPMEQPMPVMVPPKPVAR